MQTNESRKDRIIRGSVGAVLLAVALSIEGPFDLVQGTLMLALGVCGGISLATGVFGWCPVYALLGIRTYSSESA